MEKYIFSAEYLKLILYINNDIINFIDDFFTKKIIPRNIIRRIDVSLKIISFD